MTILVSYPARFVAARATTLALFSSRTRDAPAPARDFRAGTRPSSPKTRHTFPSYLCDLLCSSTSAARVTLRAPPLWLPSAACSCCNSRSPHASNSANVPGRTARSAAAPTPSAPHAVTASANRCAQYRSRPCRVRRLVRRAQRRSRATGRVVGVVARFRRSRRSRFLTRRALGASRATPSSKDVQQRRARRRDERRRSSHLACSRAKERREERARRRESAPDGPRRFERGRDDERRLRHPRDAPRAERRLIAAIRDSDERRHRDGDDSARGGGRRDAPRRPPRRRAPRRTTPRRAIPRSPRAPRARPSRRSPASPRRGAPPRTSRAPPPTPRRTNERSHFTRPGRYRSRRRYRRNPPLLRGVRRDARRRRRLANGR